MVNFRWSRGRVRGHRLLIVLLALCLALVASCTGGAPSRPTITAKPPVDFSAVESRLKSQISTGSVSLNNVRAVLVSVDGQTRIRHYRHGSTGEDTRHVWSVTTSVVSTLIGIALADGLITSLDQSLAELLPERRPLMTPEVAAVTLRRLMTMTAGFADRPGPELEEKVFATGGDLVAYLLREGQVEEAEGEFVYSNASAHLVSAVLAAALQRGDPAHPRSVLDYAREELFDPLGINTRPAFTEPALDYRPEVGRNTFGWLTDPQGISNGAFGLRLTAPDMLKLGELYLNQGEWQGKRIVPAAWIGEVGTSSEPNPEYGLLWRSFSWDGHRILAAQGSEGHLIWVVPDQRMVTVITSVNWPEYPLELEFLYPLVRSVIATLEA